MYEPVGFNWCNSFKEKLGANQPLNGDKIKNILKRNVEIKIILSRLMINQFDSNLYLKLNDLMII